MAAGLGTPRRREALLGDCRHRARVRRGAVPAVLDRPGLAPAARPRGHRRADGRGPARGLRAQGRTPVSRDGQCPRRRRDRDPVLHVLRSSRPLGPDPCDGHVRPARAGHGDGGPALGAPPVALHRDARAGGRVRDAGLAVNGREPACSPFHVPAAAQHRPRLGGLSPKLAGAERPHARADHAVSVGLGADVPRGELAATRAGDLHRVPAGERGGADGRPLACRRGRLRGRRHVRVDRARVVGAAAALPRVPRRRAGIRRPLRPAVRLSVPGRRGPPCPGAGARPRAAARGCGAGHAGRVRGVDGGVDAGAGGARGERSRRGVRVLLPRRARGRPLVRPWVRGGRCAGRVRGAGAAVRLRDHRAPASGGRARRSLRRAVRADGPAVVACRGWPPGRALLHRGVLRRRRAGVLVSGAPAARDAAGGAGPVRHLRPPGARGASAGQTRGSAPGTRWRLWPRAARQPRIAAVHFQRARRRPGPVGSRRAARDPQRRDVHRERGHRDAAAGARRGHALVGHPAVVVESRGRQRRPPAVAAARGRPEPRHARGARVGPAGGGSRGNQTGRRRRDRAFPAGPLAGAGRRRLPPRRRDDPGVGLAALAAVRRAGGRHPRRQYRQRPRNAMAACTARRCAGRPSCCSWQRWSRTPPDGGS